jgi:hypothetical protein
MYLAWVYSGGTVNLDADSRQFDWSPTKNWIDATAGKDQFEHLLPSYGTGQDIQVPMLAQVGGSVLAAAIGADVAGTLVYGPEGTATGAPKYSIPATSAGPGWSSPFNDVTVITGQSRQTAVHVAGNF